MDIVVALIMTVQIIDFSDGWPNNGPKKKAFDAFKKTYVLFFLCFLSCKSGPLLSLLPYVFMLILYFTLRETYNFWPVLKKSKGN